MSSEETTKKDELIVHFQSVTGIDDVAEAVMLLDQAGWDIEVASKKYIPDDIVDISSDSSYKNGLVGERSNGTTSDFPTTSTDANNRVQLIEVLTHYGNETFELRVPDSTTISELKTFLYSECRILPNLQILSGFKYEPDTDQLSLSELGVNSRTHLFLISPERLAEPSQPSFAPDQQPDSASTPRSPEPDITSTYAVVKLKIYDEISSNEFVLILTLDTTVETVKLYTKYITDIQPSSQVWTGWPPNCSDNCTLSSLNLDKPYHSLKVRSNNETPNVPPSTMCIDLTLDTDSSPEDFEDASESFNAEDEIYVVESSSPLRTEPLIPDNVEDETAGTVHFIDGFTLRYGQTSPNFLPGSLEEAIRESCMKPAKERRMLAIYLHHDGSVLSNVFCTELLCSETVLQTFGNYFLLWGWDLTNEANKNMFLASAMKNLGTTVADTVRGMTTEQLPALLIITRSRSNTELFNVIYGNIGLSDFFATLIHAVDMYSELQDNEIREEEERAVRQQIKTEQDHAFQQSLLMDRAKDEAKKQKLMLETQEEMRKMKEKEEEEKKRHEEQSAALSQLPPEPSEDAPDVITIKFRSPTGDTCTRRFLPHQKLEVLFNYLLIQNFRIQEFKIISSWPRRDFSSMSPNTTLKELNLHSQETLIIEER